MSSTIQIKHGEGAPSNGALQSYELGYASDGYLYIGGIPTEEVPAAPAIKIADANLFKYVNVDSDKGQIKISGSSFTLEPVQSFSSSETLQYLAGLRKVENGYQIGLVSASKAAADLGIFITNGALVVGEDNCGTENPNDAGIDGVVGQLYFVWTE